MADQGSDDASGRPLLPRPVPVQRNRNGAQIQPDESAFCAETHAPVDAGERRIVESEDGGEPGFPLQSVDKYTRPESQTRRQRRQVKRLRDVGSQGGAEKNDEHVENDHHQPHA